ncbi:MAG: hypothetical protein IJ305_08595 [Oscillospiraceae bacterium]|nr:hypothetical protein [Oscillospiraceae bacterium]
MLKTYILVENHTPKTRRFNTFFNIFNTCTASPMLKSHHSQKLFSMPLTDELRQ